MTGSPLERLTLARIVPVVEITDPARGVELARTLVEAGLPVAEVTLRTPAALEAIRAIADEVPGFLVGAGTLLTPAQVEDAAEAGAHFGVSPGFTPELSRAASDRGLPFVPGAVTASEILAAADLGHTHLKFFPAEQSGGAAAVGAFASPFAALGIRFMPTGGVRPANLDAYLGLATVFAIGGTWIAPRDQITEGRFDEIGRAARTAVATVAAYGA
ncbi:bifunctional 4-hydroxy-2-oxoglutarate aldolase/2-dehydro-3-deoxy-phosphogluconate aldolase [Herbiconiux solani]|uniref:bifunctional 4-hydroxy-2-oxoglutarate aldolase/2-dehydro-3-deoxy-phosphogluconate aldolase n=1 Tax=Herbiconiux solani TaxID=661329 RepID=UPI0008247961|nr:bifunctional 4-hydroxy-2-oxoglutarate aldolase/2-dehydro-3-deoxy-phosphogluconate aldolase [Herbiconiux solani]